MVWSRPSAAPGPALMCEPRCRTRMEPAVTTWPPKTLTPRFWGFESRPLREDPPPFLCAIRLLLVRRLGLLGPGAGLGRLDLGLGLLLDLLALGSGLVIADRQHLDGGVVGAGALVHA